MKVKKRCSRADLTADTTEQRNKILFWHQQSVSSLAAYNNNSSREMLCVRHE